MKIRILTAADVKTALPMDRAIAAVRSAFSQFSADQANVPLRTRFHTDKGVTLLMPAHLKKTGDFSLKVVSIYGQNPEKGLPTVVATLMVLDPETGLPLAFMDGDSLTALRTGAAGGLAADLLARKDASRAVLFGAGVQARTQLLAALQVRPLREVTIIDPFPAAVQRLAAEIATWENAPVVKVGEDPGQAVAAADIILAATTTKTPLFDGNLLKPGTHVTGVGSFTPDMQEIDAVTVKRARVVVDSREACLAEAGDIIKAKAVIDAEIGEIVNGSRPGRESDEEITFFKSVGVAAQDAAAAAAVLAGAEAENLGQIIDLG
jgi:ornithine cyclodeaminase/alanine dehydrogenase-like protein (mu-crystallin family)